MDDDDQAPTVRFRAGMRVRREVLGVEHVDAATEAITDLDRDWQRFVTETAWGSVWDRPGMDRRTRSLITIALLAGLDREELDLHLGAAPACEVTDDEIVEVLFHVAIYAGVPAANRAFGRLKALRGGDQ